MFQIAVMDTLSRLSHDSDSEVAMVKSDVDHFRIVQMVAVCCSIPVFGEDHCVMNISESVQTYAFLKIETEAKLRFSFLTSISFNWILICAILFCRPLLCLLVSLVPEPTMLVLLACLEIFLAITTKTPACYFV